MILYKFIKIQQALKSPKYQIVYGRDRVNGIDNYLTSCQAKRIEEIGN